MDPAASPGTPPSPAPATRRERIFAAAVDLLVEVGLHAAQTRAVTERAGVGTGLLNHYFRWPELRAAAWAAIFDHVAADMFPPGEAADAGLDRFLSTAFAPEAQPLWRLWAEAEQLAGGDAPIAQALDRARRQQRDGLTDLLRRGVGAGLWRLPDPAATALRIEALRDGLAGLLMSGDAGLGHADAARHLETLFRLETGRG